MNANVYARPNRRTRGQRRQASVERRRKIIWVSNCRRRGKLNRRWKDDRRPGSTAQWQSLKTVKPAPHLLFTGRAKTSKGTLINISV